MENSCFCFYFLVSNKGIFCSPWALIEEPFNNVIHISFWNMLVSSQQAIFAVDITYLTLDCNIDVSGNPRNAKKSKLFT